MIGHSVRLADALLHLPIRVEPLVDWSKGRGYPWNPLTVLGGGHSCDATQQARWNMSGTFAKNIPIGSTGINSRGCRVRVRMAVTALGIGTEILPAGVYSVTSTVPGENSIQISGASFETDCIGQTFPTARSFPSLARMTYRQQTEKLVTEAVPDATFKWDGLQDTKPMPVLQVDSDRWGTIDGPMSSSSIMGALGGEMFCNSYGAFQARPVPTIDGPVVGEILRGESLIEPSVTEDRDGVYNLIVLTATPADGSKVIGPVFSWDRDPSSRTYAGPDPLNHPELAGLFGIHPYRYDNPLIPDTGLGKTAADALLSLTLGSHEVVSVDALYCPFYEAGDIIAVPNARGIMSPKLIDIATWTWGSDKVSYATRSPKEDIPT